MVELSEIESQREKLKKIIANSDINYITGNRWMRPCPCCGSEDTAVYRWNKITKKGFLLPTQTKFVASSDNLPLRKK